jgi:hypothetical protein
VAPFFVLVSALLGAAGGALVFAQAPAHFAGTWQLEGTAPLTDAAGRDVPPMITVEQDATTLTIAAPRSGLPAPPVAAYKLDGALSVNTMVNGDQVRSKARWQGASLVVEGIGALGEEVVTIHETRVLEDGGATMVVETSAVTNLGGARTRTVVRYRKQ